MEYNNEKSGALFKNTKATEENKQPQYRGSVVVEGVEYSVASWIRKSKKGVTYMSLKLSEKEDSPSSSSSAASDADAPF
jgi:uncharacterized protein (DUF736 family)